MHARLPGLGTALAALAFHAHPAAAAGGGAPFLQTLATFSGPGIGWHPQGTQLAADAAGAVYGTTARTGIVKATIWKLAPPAAAGGSYQLTTLHSFSGNPNIPPRVARMTANPSPASAGPRKVTSSA